MSASERGDCFAYALARELGEPLLFKGDVFNQTDIPFVGTPGEQRRLSEIRAGYAEELVVGRAAARTADVAVRAPRDR